MKIKTGDKVVIIKGKDLAKNGKVIQCFPKENKVVVEGLNIIKKHMKPSKRGDKGQIIEISAPLTVSKVALLCPKCEKRTRVGYLVEGNKKQRICRKCKETVE
ncbi:MAG: 50S ribosomal protein L24 [bacterium]